MIGTKKANGCSLDVFGDDGQNDMDAAADDLDEVLSNTSIASFHEYPPQVGYVDCDDEAEGDRSHRSGDISFGGHSNRSLDAMVSELVWGGESQSKHIEGQDDNGDGASYQEDERQPPEGEEEMDRMDEDVSVDEADHAPHTLQQPALSPTSPLSPLKMNFYGGFEEHAPLGEERPFDKDGHIPHDNESVSSIKPEAIVSPAPRTAYSQEVTVNRFEEVLNLPPTPTEIDRLSAKPSLEERLKRVVSPALSALSSLRTSTSPALQGTSHSPAFSVSPRPGFHEASDSPALQAISPRANQRELSRSPAVVSPPRPAHHQRAYTYDFDERPLPLPEFEDESEPEEPHAKESRSPVSANFDFAKPGVDIAEMDMRSALDRLVDDVSIAGGVEPSQAEHSMDRLHDQSMTSTAEGEASMGEMTADGHGLLSSLTEPKSPIARAELSLGHSSSMPTMSSAMPRQSSSEGTEDYGSDEDEPMAVDIEVPTRPSHSASDFSSQQAPPVPPKTPEKPQKSARQAREEMIRERRREARARESGEYFVPPRRDAAGNLMDESPASRRRSGGNRRPSARRSMSTGDVKQAFDEDGDVNEMPVDARRRVSQLKKQKGGVLGMTLQDEDFQSSIERELKRKDKDGKKVCPSCIFIECDGRISLFTENIRGRGVRRSLRVVFSRRIHRTDPPTFRNTRENLEDCPPAK